MVPIHVVSGFLGAGKTTLILDQLARREGRERCAVVVNDFGTAQFDKTLLEGKALVKDIPGGCVCCTAPENLAPSVMALLEEGNIDRIFVEATGLAHPADIIDTLNRQVTGDIEIAPVIVVLDPERLTNPVNSVMLEQLRGGDVLVVNHGDRASEDAMDRLRILEPEFYPPFIGKIYATRGVITEEAFEIRPKPGRHDGIYHPVPIDGPLINHDHDHDHAHDHEPVSDSTHGFAVSSICSSPEVVYDMGKLRAIFKESNATRIKGIFHTDIGWYRMEVSGHLFDRAPTQVRSASRADVILLGTSPEAKAIITQIEEAIYVPPEPGAEDVVTLMLDRGTEPFSREALMALPGQVADVSTLVPGRGGSGVLLRSVFEAVGASEGVFVVVARDGMTTEPVPVRDVGDAVLVHSLGGEPFPGKKGGPFRIFVPPEPDRSACANVKKVDRIVIDAY